MLHNTTRNAFVRFTQRAAPARVAFHALLFASLLACAPAPAGAQATAPQQAQPAAPAGTSPQAPALAPAQQAAQPDAQAQPDVQAQSAGAAPAQAQPQPAAETPAAAMPAAPQAPAPSSRTDLEANAHALWHDDYERAREDFLQERYATAAAEFAQLEHTAHTIGDRQLAGEIGDLARVQAERKQEAERPELRTTDELSVLYTTAVAYGLGTSAWVTLQLQPKTFGAALLPFAILTPAAVGAVALSDGYRPLRHGIPHAIAAGVYLGFGEGAWLVAYQRTRAHHRHDSAWHSETVSTALWAGATGGGVVGGLLGALRRPTPGRVSFTASSAIWAGAIGALAANAIEQNRGRRGETTYGVGGIGYNVGLLGGIIFGPVVAPSVARVRFIDLGGIAGTLVGAGAYALVTSPSNSRGPSGAAAIGGAVGLALAWWATSDMPADRSHDYLAPAIGKSDAPPRAQPAEPVRVALVPAPSGFMASVQGEL